jgi:two-component system OmpR family sensor kinase
MSEKQSIATRTTYVVLIGSLTSGLFAALLAAVALDVLIARHADRRLRAAVDTLAIELNEERVGQDKLSLDELLDHENEEISTSGIRLAVFEGEMRLAGEHEPFVVAPETCRTQTSLSPVLSCAKSYERWTLVAAQIDDQATWRKYLAVAVVLSLFVGVVSSYFFSRRLGAWAVEPLTRLSRELSQVDLEARTGRIKRREKESHLLEVYAVEQAVDTLLVRVASLLDASRRFSRDAAHELLTPLAATSAELQLFKERRAEGGQAAYPDLAPSIARLHRLSELVESLLVLATDPGVIQSSFEPVSLDECITDVVEDLPREKRERIVWERQAEGLIQGEPVLLRAALQNGIENALKFSDGSVHMTLTEENSTIIVRVADEGSGIPSDMQDRVLDAFVRGTERKVPGHGIGLALVVHVMNAHRGSVGFDHPPRGTCLRLTFPRWTSGRA